jgi:16S rRNA (cytidine1402-2'-O)-methyltransferase
VLQLVDGVACEDTRHTAPLLQAYGLDKPLWAVHQHNEQAAAQTLIERLARGERVAYVSDAGSPGISDPGARLCAAVRAAGHRCIPLPGTSSVTALVSVAGLAAADGEPAFEFTGFLPPKGAERARALQRLQTHTGACVLLEAPHRIATLARDLAPFGERPVTVGRELTKQFEEVATLPCAGFADWLQASPHRNKGEFALVLHPLARVATAAQGAGLPPETLRVLALLIRELPVKTAARLCADITGAPKNALYSAALALKADPDGEP